MTPPNSSSLKKMTDLNTVTGTYTHSSTYPATDLFGTGSKISPTLTSPNYDTYKPSSNLVPSTYSHQFYSGATGTSGSSKMGDFAFGTNVGGSTFPSSFSNNYTPPPSISPISTYTPPPIYSTTNITNYNSNFGLTSSTLGTFGPTTSSLSSGKKLFDISPPKYGTSHITYTPIQHFSSQIPAPT